MPEDETEYDPQTGKQRDRETGQFVSENTASDFVDAIEEIQEGGGFPTTKSISDRVDMTRRGALKNLKQLEQEGVVTSEEVGGSKVWRPAERE